MYYGFILASGSQINLPTKQKLRYNLHLALQDACLFLEPTEPNIQALTLLACRVEDFATPSLSWMLARTACGMLQAIGVINGQDSNSKDNERRVILFWHLNLLDKALALVFGRPPTFHRAMVREIGMPTLEDLTPWNGQSSNGIGPGLFGTHFFYQKLLLTQIMADVWHTLYEYEEQSDSRILKEIEKLNVWYGHAQEVCTEYL